MKKWIVLAVGSLLLFLGLWCWDSIRVRDSDTELALKPLAVLPLDWMSPSHSLSVTVTMPDSAAWGRIRHRWGDPDYVIALVPPGLNSQQCFDGLTAQVTESERQISSENARLFYAFSSASNCESLGKMFHVPGGSTVQIVITQTKQIPAGTDLIVKPDWLYTKDHIVGIDLDSDLRRLLILLAVIGFVMIVIAILMIYRETRGRTKTSVRQNVVPS